eukprot:2905686-Karenia_brevis.AAC.1
MKKGIKTTQNTVNLVWTSEELTVVQKPNIDTFCRHRAAIHGLGAAQRVAQGHNCFQWSIWLTLPGAS